MPDFMWLMDWTKQGLDIGDPGFKAFFDLFDSCVQLDEANKLIQEALYLLRAKESNASSNFDEGLLFESKLNELKAKIQWFPLKSEIKERLGLN